ncbi:hypothetical protein B0T16DRAFT_460871 [Cercophora newfieldiana]|uniref:AA1-like domain-containing protein n=1 Tax=Cercophora newfieldiana TaxID=92897 RepID=A0AA39XUX9_9PEZI|nr:hypothetical protein B0T16DRAFT_460871 [Cercophora newfieldiana]
MLATTISLGLMGSAAAAQSILQAWEITRLVSSGLPYRSEAECHNPLNTIAVEIQDHNSYPGSESTKSNSTQCIAKFPYCAPPFHKLFNCSEASYGSWSFTFFPTNGNVDTEYWNPGQNFTISLRLALRGRGDWYEGQAAFSVGGNMRGLCSAGGICSFSLKEEIVPLMVNQTGSL